MKIVILNRVAYDKAKYDEVIDHCQHTVIYVGDANSLVQIPAEIPCIQLRVGELSLNSVFDVLAPFTIGSPIDQLIALSEYDLLIAAEIRERLNIAGPSVAQVLIVRDKVLMKEAIALADLPHPEFFRLTDNFDLATIEFPIVFKPVDGAASAGVEIIRTPEELKARLDKLTANELKNYECEQFVDGPVFHFDGWIKKGVIQDFVASRYVNTCLEYVSGKPLGSYQLEDKSRGFRNWAQKVIQALQIESGAFHLEGILCKGQIYFLEIGHRVGGAGVARTFELKTGINLYHAHLASCIGLDFNSPTLRNKEFYGWFVFPGHSLSETWYLQGIEHILEHSQITLCDIKMSGSKGSGKISYQPEHSPVSGIIHAGSAESPGGVLNFVFDKVRVCG